MRSHRGVAISPACALLLVLVFLAGVFFRYRDIVRDGLQYDDSYITYRYAVHLAEGQGLVFNAYERVNSASSLLYTGILALAYRDGIHDLERAAAALNVVLGAAALTLAFSTASAAAGSSLIALILLLPVALSGAWTGWAASGMDTIFYAFLVSGFLWAYASGRRAVALLFLVAALLTRPEGVLLWAAVLFAELLAAPRGGRWLAAYAITGAAVLASVYAFYRLYYGDWIPQPLLLKGVSTYYAPGIDAQARALAGFLFGGFGALSIPAGWAVWRTVERAIVSRLRRGSQAPKEGWLRVSRLELFLAAFLLASMVSFVLGPRSDLVRYATHVLPVMAVAGATLWPEARERLRPAVQTACAGLFLLVALNQVRGEAARASAAFHEWASHQAGRKEVARWLQYYVPDHALVVSSDLGMIAYVARQHDFYDVLGLLSRGPLQAARRNRWNEVEEELRRRRPWLIADTVTPDGATQSLAILEKPERWFRTVTPDPTRRAPFTYSVYRMTSAGAYRFVAGRLIWGGRAIAEHEPSRPPSPARHPSR